jgi:hypothetical protein
MPMKTTTPTLMRRKKRRTWTTLWFTATTMPIKLSKEAATTTLICRS